MKFIDLEAQYLQSKEAINAAIQGVLDHGQYIAGPEITQMEQELAKFVGAKHCIAMSSGTTALQIALMAAGVESGDEVITTPFSFFATAETIMLLGAIPVFVDIDPKTYNIDPKLIEQAITPKTKAIMPVSLYGQCADFDAINAIASRHGLVVIEDGAQSLGALYKGQHSCNLSTIGCTSFFPSKPLGCYGDGGACFTNDDHLAEIMRSILNHGQQQRYEHVRLGLNGRLSSIQAAILLVKLQAFPKEIEQRQELAKHYNQLLGQDMLVPYIEAHNLSVYAQYTVQVEQRDKVQEILKNAGIPTAIHYPKPLHKQPLFEGTVVFEQSLPVAEEVAAKVLSLPFYPGMPASAVQQVADALLSALN